MTTAAVGLGLMAWSLSFFFTAASAILLGRLLATNRLCLDAAVKLFLWIWVTTFVTFVLGVAGALTAAWLAGVGAVGLLALLAIPGTRTALSQSAQEWRSTRWRIAHSWLALPRWMRWLLGIFVAYSAFRFVFLIWVLPPFVWDSLTYHLTNVAQWIQDGRIGLFVAPVQRLYSPANYEVMAAWFSVFLHHDVAIEAAGLPAYALAGLSVYAIARSLRLSAVGAWAATIGYLSTPALVFAATGTKNDPFVAAIFLFLAALILHFKAGLEVNDETPASAYLVLFVLGTAYALGTKAYILQLSVGLLVLAALPAPEMKLRGLWRRGRAQLELDLKTRSRRVRRVMLVLVACGLVLGGYWNLRNWVLKGNPFYPYEVAVETQPAPGTGSGNYGIGLARLEANLRVLEWKFGDKHSRVLPDLPDTTGWGWLVYGFGLIAAAWAFVVDRRFRYLTLAFGASMLLMMASNTTSRWNMRYFIWLPALFALGIGVFIDPMEAMEGARRRVLAWLFGFGLAMNGIMVFNYNLVPMEVIARMAELRVWDRDAGRLPIRVPEEYAFAYAFVPRGALLGYNVHENGFIYPLYRADFSQRLVHVPIGLGDSCEQIAQAMETRGTRYLFVAPEHTDDDLISQLRECASTDSPIRERVGGLYVVKRDGDE